jgi:RNA polymerase sigma-70 factor (family 1)
MNPDTEAVFKSLFEAEYPRLCRYAYTYMQDMQQAEDVVQDTFVKIWEQKRELIGAPNIRFYLVTAVRNNCISVLRKAKTQQLVFTEEAPEPEPEPAFTVEIAAEEDTQVKRIADALNLLPPKCREIFLMIKLHGMSYKEAAATLELSVKTIENQMGKAIRILRESSVLSLLIGLAVLFFKIFLTSVGVLATFSVL